MNTASGYLTGNPKLKSLGELRNTHILKIIKYVNLSHAKWQPLLQIAIMRLLLTMCIIPVEWYSSCS